MMKLIKCKLAMLACIVVAVAIFLVWRKWPRMRTYNEGLMGEMRSKNLSDMAWTARRIGDASAYDPNAIYPLFITNGAKISTTILAPKIESILKANHEDDILEGDTNRFLDVWGNPFYVVVGKQITRTNSESAVETGQQYEIIQVGTNRTSKAEQKMGPFEIWKNGKEGSRREGEK